MRRTTIAIEERIYERVRSKARKERRHFQDCANELLRLGLQANERKGARPAPLPVFSMGKPLVDIADRDSLYDVMDEE